MSLIATELFVSFLILFVFASLWEHLVLKHLLRGRIAIKLLSTIGAWLVGAGAIAGILGEMQSDLNAGFLRTMAAALLFLALPSAALAVIGYLGARQRNRHEADLPDNIEETFT